MNNCNNKPSFNVSDSRESNTTSFFEYKITDKLDSYRIEQVTLWLHVNGNTGLYEVYEKISTQPRRMVFMDRHYDNASEWKKLVFTPSKLWLQNPWRKLRIEIKGVETSVGDKPVLQLNLKRREKRLKKRHSMLSPTATTTDDCHPTKKSLCCRHLRDVPLQQIYSWVIIPVTYRAYTCSGRCVVKHRNNNTWSYFSQVSKPTREPCCVPTDFEPMTVLYFDSTIPKSKKKKNVPVVQPIKKMTIKNAIVKSCGCS